jgi:hypothetical protein
VYTTIAPKKEQTQHKRRKDENHVTNVTTNIAANFDLEH